jgi:hypothetical protein
MDKKTVENHAAGAQPQRAADGPEQDGFYRSQAEVDAAFARRLASEREKWEKEKAAEDMAKNDETEGISSAENADIAQDNPAPGAIEDSDGYKRFLALWEKASARAAEIGFDIRAASRDEAFAALINAGMSLDKAVAYYDMGGQIESAKASAVDEYARSIQQKRSLPRPIASTRFADGAFAFTSAQMEALDEKLKQGRHVKI